MARGIILEDDIPRVDDPGDPAGGIPPSPAPTAGTKLAKVVAGTSTLFNYDEIVMAGGPWTSFKIRVTPVNDAGSGPYTELISETTEFYFTDESGEFFVTEDDIPMREE